MNAKALTAKSAGTLGFVFIGAAGLGPGHRIAATSDLSLTTGKEHPDRAAALEKILLQCGRLGVERLIIAASATGAMMAGIDRIVALMSSRC